MHVLHSRIRCLLLSLAMVAMAGPALAVSYTLNDCDAAGCEGSTLFIDFQQMGSDWKVTLTINTDNYTGNRTGFNQVGFNGIKDWTSATLTSDPGGTWGPVVESQINANSICTMDAMGNTDKVCVAGYVDGIQNGGDYTWEFLVQGGTLMDPPVHIGAQYALSAAPIQGKIISAEAGEAVPEPSAALVFGVGLLVARAGHRRRR